MYVAIEATKWAWNESQSSGNAKLVLLAISAFCNDEGYAWPSLDTIEEATNASRPTVLQSLETLERSGEISVERNTGRGRTHQYYLRGFMERVNKGKERVVKGKERVKSDFVTDSIPYSSDPLIREEENKGIREEVLPLNREERKAIPKPEKKVKERKWPTTGRLDYRVKNNTPAAITPRKQPEGFVEFCRLFSYYAETNAVTHPELWDLPDQIADAIGWDSLESRLEVYIDRLDKVTGYAARDFLNGGWQTVTGKEYEMKKLDGKF